jgi:glycosyltransferase involved in cell wall biosynthesis
MTPISVVIITYNEELNIGRCLDAVRTIADDIVVVDSFSSDQTIHIAESKGVRVVQHVFEGHIQQKNYAISHARYPHIFSLDADELPDDQLIDQIIKVKSNWIADGYSMNRLNNYCGKWIRHGAWYPDVKLRLWDSRKGKWAGLNPHDRFDMESLSVIHHLEGDILHYSYKSIEEHKHKVEYFSTIAAQAYFNKGKKSSQTKIIFSPVFRFIRDYFLKLGCIDGKYGFVIAKLTALEVKRKYQKLLELQKDQAG